MATNLSNQQWNELSTLHTSNSSPSRHANYSSISQDDQNFEFSDFETAPLKPSYFQSCTQSISRFYLEYELYISISLLICSSAGERVTFKFIIDRMFPFKFVLIEMIFLFSFLLFGVVTLFKTHQTKEITAQMRQFPHRQILLMAGLDSIQFLGLVYSGVDVSPTMTVILMHASTLFLVFGSHFAFPHRVYGELHKFGLGFIGSAIVLGLIKILWCDWSSDHSFYSTKSALIYIASSALQGLSTLYKESALVTWGKPVNIYYLSSFLFFYQFLVMIGFSIIFYTVEDLTGSSISILNSMYNGWRCFGGVDPKDWNANEMPMCQGSFYLIVGYVLSTFCVISSINSVLQIGNQVVGRAVSGSVLAAFIVLWFYDYLTADVQNHSVFLSCHVSILDILAIVVLLYGMEIYGRDPEPDVEIITNYPLSPNASTDTSAPLSPI